MTVRVLIAHNRYQQTGGEDAVVADEAALLTSRGHEVHQLLVDNRDIPEQRSVLTSARLAVDTIWSRQAAEQVRTAVREFRPDVVHFHNTFPLISPSAYYAVRAEGVPVVQTLHNYRLLCPAAIFHRDAKSVCEDCLGRIVPWPGVVHGCYRQSRPQTGVVAAMLVAHRAARTWHRAVDRYVALTEFARQRFVAGGLPADRIVVKPNFVHPDPGPGAHRGGYALFVGRLTPEKGIPTLLAAWEHLEGRIPLKIVGDGPLREQVVRAAQRHPEIEWLGPRPSDEVLALMGDALAVIVPSEWYETFGRVVVEAYATGTPVISSRIGALAELVDHGTTGLTVEPGQPGALADGVRWAMAHPVEWRAMATAARRVFEERYTAERNYDALLAIYAAARRCRELDGAS